MFLVFKITCRKSFNLTAAGLLFFLGILLILGTSDLKAQTFTENFDVVPVPGWTTQNNSTVTGSTGWFPGRTQVFTAHTGANNSYAGVDFNSTTGTNTISNWMISPQRT